MEAELTVENRFSGLAQGYDIHRPSYPTELLDHIQPALTDGIPKLAVDVGAGTGIATRQLAKALPDEWQLIGIEPNDDMRAQAQANENTNHRVRYDNQQAESLSFDAASVGLMTVAQAIHWFDRPAFFACVGDVLAPGSALAVLYNDRDTSGDGLLGRFEDLMEREMPGYDRHYRRRSADAALDGELAALPWAVDVQVHRVRWEMPMPPEGFAGLMLSRSKLKPYTAKLGADAAERELIDLADTFKDDDGLVRVGYTSRVHIVSKG